MNEKSEKIIDRIPQKFSDFLSFCDESGKQYVSELNGFDFVAFRTRYSKTREEVNEIKDIINGKNIEDFVDDNVQHDFDDGKTIGAQEVYSQIESDSDLILEDDTQSEASIELVAEQVYSQEMNIEEDVQQEKEEVLESNKKEHLDHSEKTLRVRLGVKGVDCSNVRIRVLQLSVRATNCLKQARFKTVDDILDATEGDLRRIKNMGVKSVDEIISKVRDYINECSGVQVFAGTPLSTCFGVEHLDFSSVGIEVLDLNARPYNCLKRANCNKISDVLELQEEEIRNMRNMGEKSAKEIIEKVGQYVTNPDNLFRAEKAKTEGPLNGITTIKSRKSINHAVNSMVKGEKICFEEYSLEEENALKLYESSIKILGNELCANIITNPSYGEVLEKMFFEFSAPYFSRISSEKKTMQRFDSFSAEYKQLRALPFLKAYTCSRNVEIAWLSNQIDKNIVINQIPLLYRTIQYESDFNNVLKELDGFISWLDFDVNQIATNISETLSKENSNKNKRMLEVFNLRNEGLTLEEIGKQYGVTRERIRQIESKAYKSFWDAYRKQQHDLIMLIYALRDGDDVLYFDEIKETIGDYADIVWACMKHDPDQEFYYYSKTIDAILIRAKETSIEEGFISDVIDKYINELPPVIEPDQVKDSLMQFAEKNPLPMEILEKEFVRLYRPVGSFYCRGRITVSFMCEYVLKTRFPAGFKTGDDFESERFKQHMIEFFGDAAKAITYRALNARVGQIGILCDRGKYIHPDYMQIDPSVIDTINNYIEQSARLLLPYGEIYEALRDTLENTQITNRYLLQGALKKYGCKFSTGRDFVRKKQSVTFVDELETFIEERGVVHKSEILAEFLSLGEAGLSQVAARSTNVFSIDNGYYIHASVFDIQPEDYTQLREYLKEACEDIPVNIRSVRDNVAIKFPEFMYRNDFEDRNKLFAALNYMFRGEFNFSRPYIAKLGERDITNRGVILQHIEDYDSIEIEELIDICDDNSINYVAPSFLCQLLAPDYLRVSRTTLMKKELTGVTSEVIEETVSIVNDMLKVRDYVVSAKVEDYLWFPQVEVDWNEFLLESLIVQSKRVNIVYLIGDPLKHPNAVFVSDKYKEDTFDSLLIKVLTGEVRKGTFTSKDEMRDWLREEGLIEVKLPGFLESDKYFFVNETGVHCTND